MSGDTLVPGHAPGTAVVVLLVNWLPLIRSGETGRRHLVKKDSSPSK